MFLFWFLLLISCSRQVDTVAIRSKATPYLANFWLSKCNNSTAEKTQLCFQYVDDAIVGVKKLEIDEEVLVINNLHENLKFTREKCKIVFPTFLC